VFPGKKKITFKKRGPCPPKESKKRKKTEWKFLKKKARFSLPRKKGGSHWGRDKKGGSGPGKRFQKAQQKKKKARLSCKKKLGERKRKRKVGKGRAVLRKRKGPCPGQKKECLPGKTKVELKGRVLGVGKAKSFFKPVFAKKKKRGESAPHKQGWPWETYEKTKGGGSPWEGLWVGKSVVVKRKKI